MDWVCVTCLCAVHYYYYYLLLLYIIRPGPSSSRYSPQGRQFKAVVFSLEGINPGKTFCPGRTNQTQVGPHLLITRTSPGPNHGLIPTTDPPSAPSSKHRRGNKSGVYGALSLTLGFCSSSGKLPADITLSALLAFVTAGKCVQGKKDEGRRRRRT